MRKPVDEQQVIQTFPYKGLAVADAFTQQPEQTTAMGLNVRAYDPLQNRQRGGSRSGISKYTPGQVVPDVLIQELNTVPYLTPLAIGSNNYGQGGLDQTLMKYPGSYLLGKQNVDGSYGLSVIIGLDGDGQLHVGVPIDGYPVGPDILPLQDSSQIQLPTNYNIVAYWQPGAFPLSQGFWQVGDQFPGFGFFGNEFPGGFIDDNFGFPGANVPEFVASETPDIPFWNWNSGFDITVQINLGITRCMLVFNYISVGVRGQIGINGYPGATPGASSSATAYQVNGTSLGAPVTLLTILANDDVYKGSAQWTIYTDDLGPFQQYGATMGGTVTIPWSYLQIDTSLLVAALPLGYLGDIGALDNVDPAGLGQTFTAIIQPLPIGVFQNDTENDIKVAVNLTAIGYYNAECILGLFRFRNFEKGWILGVSNQIQHFQGTTNKSKYPIPETGYNGVFETGYSQTFTSVFPGMNNA